MALPPTIPTSFVPRTAVSSTRRPETDFGGVLSFFAYAVFSVVFLSALGVFFYGRILASELASKEAELAKAEAAIDQATIEGFIQLRNRLDSSQKLLEEHKAFSGFFAALGTLLPGTVRFTSLHVVVDPSGAALVDGAGVSKSFNALSVASAAFARDGRIKDVIFSKMTINKDSSVSFTFSAKIDPKLLVFSPSSNGSSMPVTMPTTAATSTPAGTTSPTTL